MKKAVNLMAGTQKINKKIAIPSDIQYIRRLSREITGYLSGLKIGNAVQFDVRLAVEEAVRNSIEHGHCHDKNLSIIIDYTIDRNKIKINVEDKGEGFDPKKLPDPRREENIMKGSGRGVLLINKLMDEVVYNEKGNKVTMVKYFR